MTEPDMQRADMQQTAPADPVSLEHAVELMRADIPVRDDWRNALLSELSNTPRPERTLSSDFLPEVPGRTSVLLRPWSVQPAAALAACLLAMLVGAAGTLAIVNRSASSPLPTTTVASGASIPLVNTGSVSNASEKRQMIRFAFVAPGATHVSVVGDFNNWDPKATPLKTTRDGSTWLIEMPLTAGRHVYAFVVDGDIVADPSAPRVVDHDFGVQNSVILVGSL